MARPAYDRAAFLRLLTRQPRRGRLVLVNERRLAEQAFCHRSTIGRMITDLERSGSLRRFRNSGRMGLLLDVTRSSGNSLTD